jgi:hypothetical protein
MSGKEDDAKVTPEDEVSVGDSADDTLAETVILTDDDDALVDESTVEMDIEKLVARLEDMDSEDVHRRAEIRHKLEELRELREQELDDTFNISLDDD